MTQNMGHIEVQPENLPESEKSHETAFDNNLNVSLMDLASRKYPNDIQRQKTYMIDTARSILQYADPKQERHLTLGAIWTLLLNNNCQKLRLSNTQGIQFIGQNGEIIDIEKAILKDSLDKKRQQQLDQFKNSRMALINNLPTNNNA